MVDFHVNRYSKSSTFKRHSSALSLPNFNLTIDAKSRVPKYKQIVNAIANDIEKGIYKKNDQLLSITELSIEYLLSRDTVEKAYRELKEKGYITAVQGKGYFVKSRAEQKKKILMVLNKLSAYKKITFESFSKAIGNEATIDLHIYNYDVDSFEHIIENNLGKYNYYVVMPHFGKTVKTEAYLPILERIPSNELILLDRYLPELGKKVSCVYQDFERDIFTACESNLSLFKKYKNLCFVFPENVNYPEEILRGFRSFCMYNNFHFSVENSVEKALESFSISTAFIVIEEDDLAKVIQFSRKNNLTLGNELGLLSFNETILKELLGITVISTNFEEMGKKAATHITENAMIFEKNEFLLINRNSL